MKQTSGALSFLLSAYRSVFKSAYTKGIAAAVVLTAGLAAGAAQATTIDEATTINAASETKNFETLDVNAALTVDKTPVYVKDSVTVNSELKVTGSGASIVGAENSDLSSQSKHTAVFTGNKGANVTVTSGYIEMNRVVINDGTYTVGGQNGVSTTWDHTSFIGGGMGNVEGNGFEIHGGTINLNNASHLMIASDETMLIDGGTINIAGDNTTTAFIRGVTGSTINMNGGAINVTKKGGIFAPEFNLNKGSITVNKDATLLVEGAIAKNQGEELTADAESFDVSDFTIAGGTFTNNGTTDFKDGLTATSGTINNAGILNLYGRTELIGANVTNTGAINVYFGAEEGQNYGLNVSKVSTLVSGDASITLHAEEDQYNHITVDDEDIFKTSDINTDGDGNFALNAEDSDVTVDSDAFYRVSVGNLILNATQGAASIAEGKTYYAMEGFDLTSADANNAKTATVAGNLILGSNEDVVGTSGYEPTINEGEGTLNGVNLTISGKVDFQAGNWSNVGNVNVEEAGTLNVESSVSMGKLTAGAENDVTVVGGSLTASAVDLVENSVSATDQGSVILDADDVIKAYNAETDVVTVTDGADNSSKFEAGSVALDGSSSLTLNGANTSLGITSVNGDEFQKIYAGIMGQNATGTLVLGGVTVTIADADKSGDNVKFDAAEKYQGSTALATETVAGVTATGVTTGTNTWGTAVL